MDRGAWWATFRGIAESRTRLKWLSTAQRVNSVRISLLLCFPKVGFKPWTCTESFLLSYLLFILKLCWFFYTLNYSLTWLFSSVQLLGCVRFFAVSWTAVCHGQASLSFSNCQSLLKLRSIEFVMSSNHLIFCHPLPLLPSIFPSIRVFSSESVLLHQMAQSLEL